MDLERAEIRCGEVDGGIDLTLFFRLTGRTGKSKDCKRINNDLPYSGGLSADSESH